MDELWLLEHPPVFTLGLAAKKEHLLTPGEIAVIQTDRGGQVTYHGPGQWMIYTLLDLKRLNIGIRQLVCRLETSLINLLAKYQVNAYGKREAPGVYIDEKKIASIGLKVSRGYTYHGIGFNIDTDLTPFTWINPCGYHKLKMTKLTDFDQNIDKNELKKALINQIKKTLGYDLVNII